MKTITHLFFLLAFLPFLVFAQVEEFRKLDEFGAIQYGDTAARMDSAAYHLINHPKGKLYIIVYGGQDNYLNLDHRYARRLKNYLTENRYRNSQGITSDRIVAIGGGRHAKQRTEIWYVPDGVAPPVPTSSFSVAQVPSNQIVKFDDYPLNLPNNIDWDSWDGRYEDVAARLERVAQVLKQRADLRLLIIGQSQGVYSYRPTNKKAIGGARKYVLIRDRKLSDPINFDKKIADQERNHLARKYAINSARIMTFGAGYSKSRNAALSELSEDDATGSNYVARSVELWIIPKNASKSEIEKIFKRRN